MSFWDFILTWPIWIQILSVILLILFLFLVIKNGIDISKGKFKISIGEKHEHSKEESPHKNCPYSRDIVILLNDLDKLRSERWQLLYIEKTRDQMNYAEQKAEQAKAVLQRKYLSILAEKNIPQVVSSSSFIAYQIVLKNASFEILRALRQSFRENHFDEMGEKDFSNFVTDKVDYILSYGTDLLNSLYFFHDDVTREELYNKNTEIVPKLREIAVDVFDSARKISMDNKVKIMALDEKMDKILNMCI